MEKRKLGNTGFEVAPLALGGNVFGWTADETTSFGLLDAFVGAGFNLIDTADSYSRWVPGHQGGESESIIGRWIAQRSGATMAQVALAWLMRRPSVTAPIASATSVAQLGELTAAAYLRLDPDAIRALDQASA